MKKYSSIGFSPLPTKKENFLLVRGFTVLELIIVIGIMCILISLILVGLDDARAHSADQNKISEIQTVVVGLGQYHDICNVYPDKIDATTTEACLGGQTFASLVPDIAKYNFNATGSDFMYAPLADALQPAGCIAFHIGVKLQKTDSPVGAKSGFVLANQPQSSHMLGLCDVGIPDTIDGSDPLTFDIEK